MSDDLYFIPPLFEAMGSSCVAENLRQALHTIITLGKEERFQKGYKQFEAFMEAAVAAHQLGADEGEATAIFSPDGMPDLLNELVALPELAAIWDRVKQDFQLRPDSEVHVGFLLRRNEEPAKNVRLSREQRKGIFHSVHPGTYTLSLSSGRVIWETELTRQDLLSAYALADEPLQLAADTEGIQEEPTRQDVLLDGEVVVSVFAGPESGRLEIERRSA
jgi:hypothetical protein